MKKRILSLMLAAVMVAGTLAACGTSKTTETTEKPAADATESTDESASQASSDTPLVVGYNHFSEKFSTFFTETDYDREVALMTQVDRKSVV